MKTKLYRTITLVLAVIMLLGVTPAFAAGHSVEKRNISYWENHEYDVAPYDYNISADPNGYIPFSALWEYGDRTSASSKGPCWELADGICYVNKDPSTMSYDLRDKGISLENLPRNMETNYFEGNTHIKTAIFNNASAHGPLFQGVTNLKLAIILDGGTWMDWSTGDYWGGQYFPTFPHNITVIGGLLKGEMYIANSNNKSTRITFKGRAEFVEAVRPILASAHLTDKAWSMIPAEFGGEIETNPVGNHIVSDWAKDEFAKARSVGIIDEAYYIGTSDETKVSEKRYAAQIIINTYEAICRDTGKSTNYPSPLPETFGRNPYHQSANKAAAIGILKGDGTTSTYNGKTYLCFNGWDNLTREQMAAMLTRLAKACGKTLPTGTMPFTDSMSDWAKSEVSACYNAGMIKGTSATTFGAYDNITGEQAIVLCYRAYVYLTTH